MTTLEQLEEAAEKIEQAMKLLSEAKGNESLRGYYGNSLGLITQELDAYANNNNGYIGGCSSIREIVDGCGDKWEDE